MSEVEHIRSLVRQASLYRAQGLYAESRAKYKEILSLLASSRQIQNVDKLVEAVQKRLENVELDLQTRDLRDSTLDNIRISDYSEFSDDCTNNMRSWIRRGVSWTRKWITKLRSKAELPGKKRVRF